MCIEISYIHILSTDINSALIFHTQRIYPPNVYSMLNIYFRIKSSYCESWMTTSQSQKIQTNIFISVSGKKYGVST